MINQPTETPHDQLRTRTRRDATAGGGAPMTGDHFAGDGPGTVMRAFLRGGGLSKEEVRRRPIIGICSSWSEPSAPPACPRSTSSRSQRCYEKRASPKWFA